MEHKQREEIIKMRATKEEKNHLKRLAKSKGLSVSDYIRERIAEPLDLTRAQYEKDVRQAIYEIHKIGVNLNQIAKKYNENQYVAPSDELHCQAEQLNDKARELVDFLTSK